MLSSRRGRLSRVRLMTIFEKAYQTDPLRRLWCYTKPKLGQQNCDGTPETQYHLLWSPWGVASPHLNSGALSARATGDAGLKDLAESLEYVAQNPPLGTLWRRASALSGG